LVRPPHIVLMIFAARPAPPQAAEARLSWWQITALI
jgi:hypothetical protein